LKVLSIISQKGGAGKTTIAIHLAVAALMNKKKAVILDMDPQASAASWADVRQEEDPAIVSIQSQRLEQNLAACKKQKVDLVIIDTAPHSEKDALLAARNSDLILIPCRPAILDLKAITQTIDLAKLAKKKAFVVLNAIPPRGTLSKDAEKALNNMGVNVCKTKLGQRAAFIHSLTQGETALEYDPKGKSSMEVLSLYRFLKKQIGGLS
jgi:chromosome partitioning protein